MVSAEQIKNIARGVGFNCCGIARCREMTEQKVFFDRWLSNGFHSGLNYLSRYGDVRYDPSALLKGAETVIVCAVNYKNNTIFESARSSSPRIATYALMADYHTTIKRMLAQIVVALREQHPELGARTFTDTAPLLEKAWAVEAGLGWIGKHSLLITPRFGSLVLLGEIVVDQTVDAYDEPYRENHCGECRRCIDACENGAIVGEKVIDTGRCIARLTIEKDAPEGALQRTMLRNWIFGCDMCQSVCPHNQKPPEADNPDFKPVINVELLTRDFWLNLDEEGFKSTFGKTPLLRSSAETIKKILSLP